MSRYLLVTSIVAAVLCAVTVGAQVRPSWLDVTAYGAKCDGSTDDSAAIQNAINLLASSGGVLHFPSGTCVFATGLTVSGSGIQLVGSGTSATTLNYTGSGTAITISAGPEINWVAVKNLTLTNGGTGTVGIETNNCKDCTLDHLLIRYFSQNAIVSEGANHLVNYFSDIRIAARGTLASEAIGIKDVGGNSETYTSIYVAGYPTGLFTSAGGTALINPVIETANVGVEADASNFTSLNDVMNGVSTCYKIDSANVTSILNTSCFLTAIDVSGMGGPSGTSFLTITGQSGPGRGTGYISGPIMPQFGSGRLTNLLVGTTTWAPGTIAPDAVASTTVSVPGAVVGDPCIFDHHGVPGGGGLILSCNISEPDTATINIYNASGALVTVANDVAKVTAFEAQ